VQVRLNVTGADGLHAYPTLSYVLKEMPGSVDIFCNGRRIEIALQHVFAQCDKRLLNYMLPKNAGSPDGSLLR
jgi:hypothetical protein